MEMTIIAFTAFVLGFIAGRLLHREHPIGDLRIDRSDPTCKPYMFLEMNTDIRAIAHKRIVAFRIKFEDFIPHE